ncbi:MAG: DUF1553 domain-containing protein [Planctomycetota bacterium]|nr:MAG: DUF1553 domain-containing protein [Planctomycetota bacterium]
MSGSVAGVPGVPRATLEAVVLLLLFALAMPALVAPRPDEAPVDFVRDVRPILSDRCFPCHGPDAAALEREGGFRLDRFADATEDLGGYAAIVPGDVAGSELVRRLRSTRSRSRMPPPRSKLTVSEREIALLERWIEQGASYAAHWAFVPPERRAPPAVQATEWPRDELDRFVLARLEAAQLAPASVAERETLLRRVTLDLTGLPPSLAAIDAFLADDEPGAYARTVERLLASPRYGERMAADWMDLARYADTYGYQNDVERRVWPWRDWVIRAFNQNLAYDAFATWQIAGDLLPDATREQRLATTFSRLHRQTNEGGSVEEEYRVEYVSDRLHTFGMAFLGLTLECARCHDHKFDPIAQRDYYALSAFFASIDESGLYSHFTDAVPTPTLLLTTDGDELRIAELELRIERAEAGLAVDDMPPAYDEWRARRLPVLAMPGCTARFAFDAIEDGTLANLADASKPGQVFEEPQLVPGRTGRALLLSGENGARFAGIGEFRRWDPFTIALWLRTPDRKERAVVLHRSRAWTDSGSRGYQLLLEDGRPSFSLIHFWPGNAIRVRALAPIPEGEWVHVAVTYDGSSRAGGLALYLGGRRVEVETVRDRLTRAIVGGGADTLTLAQRFRDRGFKGGVLDELFLFDRELSALEVAWLHDEAPVRALLAREPATWTPAEDAAVFAAFLTGEHAPSAEARAQLRDLRRELGTLVDGIPEIMTMEATPAPRPTYVLARGSYEARRERVEPDTPPAVFAFQRELPRNRLGLARWLTSPENPLFARVAVNRLWQTVFGRGLVATPENFGSQGRPPSHPALLDTLALDFVLSGYDVKAMLRRLVLSATYRQSSRASADARMRDPENLLYARAPAFRLGAEAVRDLALAASGLLGSEIGGPSVKPYQPAGLWKEKGGLVYQPDTGTGLYRRSLYTFWKRTSPPPSMMIFDMGKREVCVARRRTTNTPLQALVLMNDTQFVEASRVLAARVMRAVEDTEARIARAFRLLAGRRPSERELAILIELEREQRARFAADSIAARALLAVGAAPLDESLDPTGLAALATVASTLLSYDAVVTRR